MAFDTPESLGAYLESVASEDIAAVCAALGLCRKGGHILVYRIGPQGTIDILRLHGPAERSTGVTVAPMLASPPITSTTSAHLQYSCVGPWHLSLSIQAPDLGQMNMEASICQKKISTTP